MLTAERDVAGNMHYDAESRRLEPVRYFLVLMFPAEPDVEGSTAAGWGLGGSSWREAFARLRAQLAEHGVARARFVDWQREREDG